MKVSAPFRSKPLSLALMLLISPLALASPEAGAVSKPKSEAQVAAESESLQAQQDNYQEVLVEGSVLRNQDRSFTQQVAIIKAEDIEQMQVRDLGALLRKVPGVHVNQQGGAGGVSSVYLRGGEANFVAILVDGVQINDPTNTRGGSVDLNAFDITLIERIEIIRGPQSALYGSDALAGAINIITKGVNSQNSFVQVEMGSDEQQAAAGRVSLANSQGSGFSLAGGQRDFGDAVEGSTRQQNSAQIKGLWLNNEDTQLSFNSLYSKTKRNSFPEDSGGPELAQSDALDQGDARDWVLSIGLSQAINSMWRHQIKVSRFDRHDESASPGIAPYQAVPPNSANIDFTRDQAQWLNYLQISPQFDAVLGLELEREVGKSDGLIGAGDFSFPTNFDLSRQSKSAFASAFARPIQNLSLAASLRWDDYSDAQAQTTANLGLVIDLLPQVLSLSANTGSAYKQPSFFALGHPLVGNPELEAEKARSSDIALNLNLLEQKLNVTLTGFKSHYENLVDFDAETFTNVNRGEVDTEGAELSLSYTASDKLALSSGITYLDIDAPADTTLRGRPNLSYFADVDYRINSQWALYAAWNYGGEVYEASQHTGQNEFYTLDAYTTQSLAIHWQSAKQGRGQPYAALSLDNLSDSDYEQAVGFPAPGRQLRLSLGFKLL